MDSSPAELERETLLRIGLTRGQFALVSVEAHEWLARSKWYADWSLKTRSFRAVRAVSTGLKHPKQRKLPMQKAVWEWHNEPIPDGYTVDHINRNTLDNRLSNLRLATHSQQQQNRRLNSRNTSGYRGVVWIKGRGKWRAQIEVDGEWIIPGHYDDPIEAALARDAAARIHHGEFAQLNFPATSECLT